MHAIAAFFASIITFVSGFFAPTVASNSPVDVRGTQPAAAAVAHTEIAGNPFNEPAAASAVAAAIPATAPAPAFSPQPTQTIINQPVIERIIERIVPQGAATVSTQTLAAILADFEQSISSRIAAINPPKAAIPEQVAASGNATSAFFPASQRIDQLTNTAINTPTITGGSITNATVSGTLSGTFSGTSSFTAATTSSLAISSIPWGLLSTDGSGNIVATSTPTAAAFIATSTTATSTFAGGLTAASSAFNILQSGNVGIGTTSPTSKLHIDSGTSGFGGNPTAVIQGGGDAPTSVQLLLRNTREGGGTGNDYENEVHLRLQAGSTQDHRAYINFADYTGTDRWLTGRNASDTWILYSATSGHRMRMFNSVTDGHTEIASTGAYPVQINPSETGTSHGTGGFEVLGGGTYPAPLVFAVAPYTNDQAALRAFNNGSGYAPASLRLEASNAASRGQGIFHYNTVSDTSWFTGVPYNVAGAKWMVGYESNATWDPAVAQTSKALFTIQNNGNLGIGTTSPAKKLTIDDSSGTGIQGMRIIGNSNNYFDLGRNNATGAFVINGNQAGVPTLDVQQNSTSRLYIDSSGNVGIGTTTPASALQVQTASPGIQIGNGSSNSGAFVHFMGALNAKNWRIANRWNVSDALEITPSTANGGSTFNAPAVVIQDTGNVGIGTTSPTSRLHVANAVGSAYLTLDSGGINSEPGILFKQDSASKWALGTTYASTGSDFYLYNYNTGGTVLTADQATSNIGIGTTTPGALLGVNGNILGAGTLALTGTTGTTTIAAGQGFTIGGSQFVLQQGSGNVGIGTASPTNTLSVAGTGYISGNLGLKVSGTTFVDLALGDNDTGFDWVSDGNFALYTNNLERMRFTSTGNVGIGTTTPGARLHVETTSGSQGRFAYDLNNYTDVNYDGFNTVGGAQVFKVGGSEKVRIGSTGNVGIGTTTPTAQLSTTGTVRFSNFGAGTLTTDASGNLSVSSDERLKNIDGGFTRGLSDIMKLSPIQYHWNALSGLDTSTQYAGFSAQNVQSAIPEAVGSSTNGYLTLQDRPLIATVVNAIKELAQQVNDLAERVVTKELVAVNGNFRNIRAEELCFGDSPTDQNPVCLTKSQVAAVLAAAGQTASSPSTSALAGTSQAPVIELNGNASSTIQVGHTYNDLGARVISPTEDTNLGIVILLDGATTTVVSIDTSQPGEHTILYTVTSPTTGLTGSIVRTVVIQSAADFGMTSPPQNESQLPSDDTQPANDNASSTTVPLAI